MSNTPSGLQADRFVESFTKPSGTNNLVYTTEDFVNTTVRNYLNTSSSVDIRIGNGVSMNVVTGTTETVVRIGLSAGLGNLNDVNLAGAGTGDYLVYNGTAWVVGSGLSITDVSITDLDDVNSSTPPNNSVLFTANGTSFFFKEDRTVSIDDLRAAHTRGIVISKNSNYPYEANIQTRFLNFPTVTSDNATDFYTVTDPATGITNKIEKGKIDVSQFQNFTPSSRNIINNYLQATNNPTGTIGLCYVGGGVYNLNSSNYLTGAGGVLPISQGGTSATGAAEARINLGLSYGSSAGTTGTNYLYDIMGFSKPSFRDELTGDNINLVGTFIGSSITTPGTNYVNVSSNFYYITNPTTGICFRVFPTTGSGGSVQSITIPDYQNGTAEFFNSFASEIYGLGTGISGSGACVSITMDYSYISFGSSFPGPTVGNYGIRFGLCTPQVKFGTEWEEINRRPAIEELTNVTESTTFSDKDILIYNGTCFQPYQISGAITIGASGVASLTQSTFGVSNIDFGVSPINFGDLTGTTGSVQTQLNQKLSYTGPAPTEQGILLLNEGSCTNASVITYDETITPDAPQVPMVHPPNYDGVSFKNIFNGFVEPDPGPSYTTSDISNLETCLLDNSHGTLPYTDGIATKIPLTDFMGLITAPTGGIVQGSCASTLQLGIESLESYYSPRTDQYEHRDDFIAIGPSVGGAGGIQPNKKITISDLLHVPFFENAIHANGFPNFYTQGTLAFFTNQTGGPAGTSYLAIATGNGSSWYGVSIAAIFP